ncbi:MAG: sulfite exporter TauE/SafE family protein [Desulfobacter sp.]
MGWDIIFALLAVSGASIVRGYSGFGFALICALSLGLVFPPAVVTPIILCLDVAASLLLFWKIRHQVDWGGLKFIGLGAVLTLPLGTMALVHVPVTSIRIFISLMVISLCIALLRQKERVGATGPLAGTGVGMCAGFLNGLAALGGPPVILFYFSSDRPVAVSRASMIAFFLMVDVLALLSCMASGLVTQKVAVLAIGFMIPLGIGIRAGNLLFQRFHNEEAFRKQVIYLLLCLALASLVKSVFFA